jgi:hypothetical protein
MSSSNLRQAEALLARFPGPVSLHLRRRNKLVALSLCLGSALFLAWLLFADPDFRSRYRSYDPVMIPIGIMFFGAFGVRAAIMLLVPSVGSLTLDATGFAHNATFRTIRLSWREVGEFHYNPEYNRGRREGTFPLVTYEVIVASAWRGTPTTATRVVHDRYELPLVQVAWLMNAWRRRAFPEAEKQALASAGNVPMRG